MTQKWNLQDIRPATPRAQRTPMNDTMSRTDNPVVRPHLNRPQPNMQSRPTVEPSFADEDGDTDESERIPVINGNKRNHRQLIIGLVIGALVIGGGLTISVMTGGAKVTIYPKVREMNVNAEFTAYAEKKPGELSYEILTLDQTGERQVKASGQETVTKQATGEIEISKSTPGAERLIKNTRFQTESGLVFRVQESVVVPGAIKNAAGVSVPGTTRAQVFADEAGDKYNVAQGSKFNELVHFR